MPIDPAHPTVPLGHPPATPWWLPGGNAQTIWAALYARRHMGAPVVFERQRWPTPDHDFIDVDFLAQGEATDTAPLLVLFHGLEGSSSSHYAQAFASVARQRGWACAVPHFRGCSGEINLAPRAYHSGDHEEIDWILRRVRELHPTRPLMAVGISLGGNALLHWAGVQGGEAGSVVTAVAAVSSPLDLGAAGAAIDRGFNRHVYARMFLRTMKAKAEAKWRQFPGLFNLEAVRRARTLRDFDDAFTAPLHGFRGVDHYWDRASSKPLLAGVRVPALVINALNDPFIPASSLPTPSPLIGHNVTLRQPAQGGHAGFPHATAAWAGWPGHVTGLPEEVCTWLASHTGGTHG